MKIKIFIFLMLLNIQLFSTTLLTYNTYNREDRVDIMLSFDTPYNGKIFLKKNNDDLIITLNNINFDKTISKNIDSNIISQLKIVPNGKNINILLKSNKKINIIASKTTDGFGLRLRVIPKKTNIFTKQNRSENIPAFNNIETKKDSVDNSKYYLILIILLILLFILFYIRKKISRTSNNKSWLFPSNITNENIKILYKKPIDTRNSVMLISYLDRKYLILTGSSNYLLDKFSSDNKIIKEDNDKDKEFEKIFAQNRQKLDEFLKVSNEKLSSYRDKASLDITTEDELI